MLTRTEVKPRTWHKYKCPEDFIPEGTYYSGSKIPADLRRGLRCVAATEIKTKRFTWLMPYETWIHRALNEWTPPEAKYFGKIDLSDKETVGEISDFFRLPAGLWDKLRPWHKSRLADAAFAVKQFGQYRRGDRAPIGAGKTLYGLCLCNAFEKSVVLAPRHLQKDWADEALKWGLPLPKIISTYHSAHHIEDAEVVIEDEALVVMNPTTGVHTNAKKLTTGPNVKIVVGYTGSTCSTTPANLRWLRTIVPGCVPDDKAAWQHLFGKDTELVEIMPEKHVWVTKSWDTAAIARFIAPYCGIVDVKDIAAEMPEVTYKIVWTPKPKRWDMIKRGGGTEAGASKRVAQARQLSDGFFYDDIGDATEIHTDKIGAARELIDSTEEPFILYAAWDWTIDALARELEEFEPAVLRGGSDYAAEIAKFKEGKTRLLIANTRISTGMNLQGVARLMAFVSNGLSPIDRQQAEGRIIRPGQKNAVVIYDICATGSLDHPQLRILKEHSALSEQMVESMLAKELANDFEVGSRVSKAA